MKNFFILIFLSLILTNFNDENLFAQNKIDEGFESGIFPPPGWSTINYQSGESVWSGSGRVSHTGQKCAISKFSSTISNNILVTKSFIPSMGDSLIFYFRQTFWKNYNDTFRIIISNADSLFEGSLTVLMNFRDSISYPDPLMYGRFAVNLDSFAGQTVWVGFQHINLNGDNIRLDDISVGQNEPPAINYDPLTNINSLSEITLSNVTISDPAGVDTAFGKKPRLYFKRDTDENIFTDNGNQTGGWKYIQANNNSSPFEFTIDYSLLNGVSYGNTIQYFVVAQDLEMLPAVGINSGTFAAVPLSVSLSSSVFPIGGIINSFKINDAPEITYSSLSNSTGLSNRYLPNVEITDSDGIDTTLNGSPRIYFKKTGDDNSIEGWKFTQAILADSLFEFEIDHTLLPGLTYGDTVQYFVIAQDIEAIPAVSINTGTFSSAPENVSLTAEAFPVGGAINSYMINDSNDSPVISYTLLSNSGDLSNRYLPNVEITDSDGIDTTLNGSPRIYFKKTGDDNSIEGWKFTQAILTDSLFEFEIDHTLLPGLTYGDTVQYFVIAQDIEAIPAVSINTGTFSSAPENVSLTAEAFPVGGAINSYMINDSNDSPVISYTLLSNSGDLSNRYLPNVEITDSDGIDTTLNGSPRIYFKKTGDDNSIEGWKFTQAILTDSLFEFEIDHTLLPGLTYGDTVQYFVIAQDNEAIPAVSINKGTFSSAPENVSLTAEAFPVGGAINSYMINDSNDSPVISYTLLSNSGDLSNRYLPNVEITDSDGIDTTLNGSPRIYFKKTGDDNSIEGWKFTQAILTDSLFEFEIDHTLLPGLTYGDTVQYFVIAQDIEAIPAVSINTGTFSSAPENVSLTAEAFPVGGAINSYMINDSNDSPVISYTLLSNSGDLSNRYLPNVEITDSDGIDTTLNGSPRIYFKKTGDDNSIEGWKFTQAILTDSLFEFEIDHTLLPGLTYGDTVQYFVIAQDIEAIPAVSINTGTFSSAPENVSLTAEAFPVGGAINSYMINDSNDSPVISYTLLSNSGDLSNRYLPNVEITDSDGIDTTLNGSPRIYFKKTGDDNSIEGWKFTQAILADSLFEFEIDHTLLPGLTYGDTVQYFVIAQDNNQEPVVSINSGAFSVTPLNVSLTYEAFPITGNIYSYKINDAPLIIYTPLSNTNSISNRNLSDVVITDSDGIDTTLTGAPRIYFKRSSEDNSIEGWQYKISLNTTSPFEFEIDHSLLPGLNYGDTIQYFVTARDNGNTQAISINSGTFATGFDGVLSSVAFPIGGEINSYRINDAPVISYDLLSDAGSFEIRNLTNVILSDLDGIDTTYEGRPRIYFKKISDDNTIEGWKFIQATCSNSVIELNIDHSLIQGLTFGDTVQYFVVAQDNAPEPYVSINSGSFAETPATVSLNSEVFPIGGTLNSYKILGTVEVGVENNLSPEGIIDDCGNNVQFPKAVIRNFGTLNVDTPFDITYSITGPVNYMNTKQDTLSSGNSKVIQFDSAVINEPGNYMVKIFIDIPGDQNQENDTLISYFTIANTSYGGGLEENGFYYFANSTECAIDAPSQPEFCWKDTLGSFSLILNNTDVSGGMLTGDINDGYYSLGNILPNGKKIKYFNTEYDSVYISTNGLIGLLKNDILLATDRSQISDFELQSVPLLAPLWMDFNYENTAVMGSRLSYKIAGNQLIITYSKAPLNSGGNSEYISFQTVIEIGDSLMENSNLLFQYNEYESGDGFKSGYANNSLPLHFTGLKGPDTNSYLAYRLTDSNGVRTGGTIFNSSVAIEFGTDVGSLTNRCSQLNLTVLLEAVYPNRDTISVILRDANSPYAILESRNIYPDSGGLGNCILSIPDESYKYYLVVKHRNSIETWSREFGDSFDSYNLNYDFSIGRFQSFGRNMALIDGKSYIFCGDVNQDNIVDGEDMIRIYNSSRVFLSGYVPDDVNYDRTVDLDDIIFTYNNSSNFVIMKTP